MRLYRNAIILVVVLAVAIGAFYLLKDRVPEEDTGPSYKPSTSVKIVDFDSLKVNKVVVRYPEEEFVLNKVDKDNWQLESDKDMRIDNSRVRSIAIRMSSIFVEKEIEENPKDLSVYGLDKPVHATAYLDDGTEYSILIGNLTPTKGAYYAMLPGGDKVYTIGTYESEGILITKNDLKLVTLFEIAVEDFTQIALKRNGANAFDSYKDGDIWVLSEPLAANANLAKIDEITTAISTLQVKTYVKDSSDLAVFGLDNPKYVLSFKTNDYENSISFGNETAGSNIYAKLADRDDVFNLDVNVVNFLDVPVEEVVDSFVALPNIQNVNKVVVEIDGTTDVSEIQTDPEDSDNDKFTLNGRDASVTDHKGDFYFKKYYQGLLIAGIRDEVDIDGKPEGISEITITYFLKDGEEIKLEYVSRDDYYYYVVKNGDYTGLVVNKKKLSSDDSLRVTRKNLIEAMDKEGK